MVTSRPILLRKSKMYYIENKEVKLIDPAQFGLSPRTVLGKFGKKHFVIIKDRRSRVVMKDGQQIFEMLKAIQKVVGNAEVGLATNAPVCGRTIKYLADKGIKAHIIEK